jgi:hypothetical protein
LNDPRPGGCASPRREGVCVTLSYIFMEKMKNIVILVKKNEGLDEQKGDLTIENDEKIMS